MTINNLETRVLCTIINQPERIQEAVKLGLCRDDWVIAQHQTIFDKIMERYDNQQKIDLILIFDELVKCDLSIKTAIANEIPIESGLQYYVDGIKQHSRENKLKSIAHEFKIKVDRGDTDAIDSVTSALDAYQKDEVVNTPSFAHDLQQAVARIDHQVRNKDEIVGIETGLKEFDELTFGLQPGQLFVIAARPGMGKTVMGLNIAQHAAFVNDKSVAFFSLEMAKSQLIERLLCSETNIDGNLLRKRSLNDDDWQQITKKSAELQGKNLSIIDDSCLTLASLSTKSKQIKYSQGLDLIVLDYLHLMSHPYHRENEVLRIGDLSRGLKILAGQLECPVIALSQLNRAVEQRQYKKPVMSDLRASGAIEQDSDIIGFIYRDEMYETEEQHSKLSNQNIAEFDIVKHRNGETKNIMLMFYPHFYQFADYKFPTIYRPSYQKNDKPKIKPYD